MVAASVELTSEIITPVVAGVISFLIPLFDPFGMSFFVPVIKAFFRTLGMSLPVACIEAFLKGDRCV